MELRIALRFLSAREKIHCACLQSHPTEIYCTTDLPEVPPIAEGGPDVAYCMMEDDAFACRIWLMKPNSKRGFRADRVANYGMSRGRRVVENAKGKV